MWQMILAQGASTLLGRLFSRGDRKRAKRAQQQQEAILRQIQALAGEGADRGRRFMDTYERDFAPVAREAVDAARQVGRPDFAAINADNATAFQQQGDAMTRSMQRAGINPLDGAWASAQADLRNNEAASLVLNRNTARRGAASDRFNALSGAASLGQMPLQAGISLFGNATSALGGVADRYSENANMYRDSAAATQQGVGQIIGNIAGSFKGGGKAGGIPWGNFVQRAGTPLRGNMAPTGVGVPGYVTPWSNNNWWATGGA